MIKVGAKRCRAVALQELSLRPVVQSIGIKHKEGLGEIFYFVCNVFK